MDVKSAFLNDNLKEGVYVQQPPGYAFAGEEKKVYKLRKALYGLQQAPRAWNAKLDATLKKMGFQQSASSDVSAGQWAHCPACRRLRRRSDHHRRRRRAGGVQDTDEANFRHE
jgi:hypothetical protein